MVHHDRMLARPAAQRKIEAEAQIGDQAHLVGANPDLEIGLLAPRRITTGRMAQGR